MQLLSIIKAGKGVLLRRQVSLVNIRIISLRARWYGQVNTTLQPYTVQRVILGLELPGERLLRPTKKIKISVRGYWNGRML